MDPRADTFRALARVIRHGLLGPEVPPVPLSVVYDHGDSLRLLYEICPNAVVRWHRNDAATDTCHAVVETFPGRGEAETVPEAICKALVAYATQPALPLTPRIVQMLSMHHSGDSIAQIGAHFGISRERVRQLLRRSLHHSLPVSLRYEGAPGRYGGTVFRDLAEVTPEERAEIVRRVLHEGDDFEGLSRRYRLPVYTLRVLVRDAQRTPRHGHRIWTPENVLETMRDFALAYGKPLRVQMLIRQPGRKALIEQYGISLPSYGTICTLFGNWIPFMEALRTTYPELCQ